MATRITKFIDPLISRPSAATAMVWSLGLHATVFAATYTWWVSPIVHVSFAGNRFVAQIEATFSEMTPEEEIETFLEFKPMPATQMVPFPMLPVEELPQESLSQFEPKLDADPLFLQLPNRPLQDDDANKIIKVKLPDEAVAAQEFAEIYPLVSSKKSQPESDQPSRPEATAGTKQFVGIEEKVPPDLAGNRPPIYPEEAIRKRLEGVVLLRLTIAVSGQVERVEIAKSSGYAILDHRAVEAVSTWHARPAEQEGKPVATVEILPIRFRL